MKRTLLVFLAFVSIGTFAFADDTPAAAPATAAPAVKYFVMILHPAPRLHEDSAWTETDNAAVYAHFKRLQEATAAGRVLIAGKTDEPGNVTFGLVVFSAADANEARAFMEADPCVTAGVMTAELHPYMLALRAK